MGRKWLPVSREPSIRAHLLDEGGPAMWEAFMDELRETHLGSGARRHAKPDGPPAAERLRAAYEAVVARGTGEP